MSSLYLGSAQVLVEFLRAKSPLTSAIYSSSELPAGQRKAAYAVTLGTLRYKQVLDQVLDQSNLMRMVDRKTNRAVVLVMLYDLLLSPTRAIQGGGSLKKELMQHANLLRTTLVRLKVAQGAQADEDLLPSEIRFTSQLPRYARVNSLRATLGSVHDAFALEGYRLQRDKYDHRTSRFEDGAKQYFLDAHIPNLLVFAPGTDLHDHPLLVDGRIILQDKASCITAAVLDPTPTRDEQTFHVLDACAAPGNKTTHLLAIAMDHCRKNMPNALNTAATPAAAPAAAAVAPPAAGAKSTLHDASGSSKKRPRASMEDDELDVASTAGGKSRATGASVSFEIGLDAKDKAGPVRPRVHLEAFEVDPTRYQLLQRMMSRALPTPYRASGKGAPDMPPGASVSPACVPAKVTLTNKSFLDLNPRSPEYATVRAILLDPTCSGSGMLHRIEQFYKHRVVDAGANVGTGAAAANAAASSSTGAHPSKKPSPSALAALLATSILPVGREKKAVMENVAQLAEFQKGILLHALSFPNVDTVAYSTCSVHAAEDEGVLEAVLAARPEFELASALPSWHRRGAPNDTTLTEKQAAMCVRSDGAGDGMNGFFVAKLVRKSTGATAAAAAHAPAKPATGAKPTKASTPDQPDQLPSRKKQKTTPIVPPAPTATPSSKAAPKRSRPAAEDEEEAAAASSEPEDEEDEVPTLVPDESMTTDGAAAAAHAAALGRQTLRNKKKREKAKLKKQKLQPTC